jgi:hypothetical protein
LTFLRILFGRWRRRATFGAVVLATLALICLATDTPRTAEAFSPGATITVGNNGDLNTRDDSFSLREAIIVAGDTGDSLGRGPAGLSPGECASISDGQWNGTSASCECVPTGCNHGVDHADTIIFNAWAHNILLTDVLPELNKGGDSITGAGLVTITGVNRLTRNCLNVTSDQNILSGLTFQNCETAISVRSGHLNIIGAYSSAPPVTISNSHTRALSYITAITIS